MHDRLGEGVEVIRVCLSKSRAKQSVCALTIRLALRDGLSYTRRSRAIRLRMCFSCRGRGSTRFDRNGDGHSNSPAEYNPL